MKYYVSQAELDKDAISRSFRLGSDAKALLERRRWVHNLSNDFWAANALRNWRECLVPQPS